MNKRKLENIAKAKRALIENKHKHKKAWSSYEIKVPTAYKTDFEERVIQDLSHEFLYYKWAKFSYKDFPKSAYLTLRNNFELEVCDLEIKSDPEFVYVAISSEMNPYMTPSERYKYIAIMVVTEGCINYLWAHPFLRGKGFIRNFLVAYACHENPIAVNPPITDQMQHCMRSVENFILSDPELKEKSRNVNEKFLVKLYDLDLCMLKKLDFDFFTKFTHGISVFEAQEIQGAINIDKEKKSKIFNFQVEFLLRLQNNPDMLKKMEKDLENIDFSDMHDNLSKTVNGF